MIGITAKEAEEKTTEVVLKNRHNVRHQYWEQALEAFQHSACTLFNNVSPSKDHWLSAGSGVSSCPYSLIFSRKEIRVDLNLGRASATENTFLFDYLLSKKEAIETAFGAPLEWLILEGKKSCRIQFARDADGFNKELWPEWVDWHLTQMSKLEQALKAPLQQAAEALKKKNIG
jgi:hypothetical protein